MSGHNVVRLPDDLDAIEQRQEEAEPLTMDLELDPPVEFQKKTFSVLHLREPTSGQVEQAMVEIANVDNTYTRHRMGTRLVARVAKVPHEVVLAMPETQVARASSFLFRLLERGQQTIENS